MTTFNEKMVRVAHLTINKYRAKYNDVVRKKLEAAKIAYKEIDTKFGYNLMVSQADFSAAAKVVLGVSLTNPRY